MNEQQRHQIEYLLSQIEDDNLGLDMCLQHITGQEIMKQPRQVFRVEPVSHANTPRVIRTFAIGTLIVTIAAFITSTVLPWFIYVVPAYLGWTAFLFGVRQRKLALIGA